ncbi:MAG: saccharopine dehydrogenase NADP-binding domain-containing protein [Alphaproteobacteria bacterium]|nr:saccharopine dehydrogenase NADP-binding domain-containing protein [Alphaproteobacteria bacterium]MCW5744068.1 saccharopine dehydrogenase NADP-binding domain-containing protein [Alphaproteobacteria bacterium]
MAERQVAVVGAAGHTGRFVVAELARRGLTPIAVGRDAARLAAAGFAARAVAIRTAAVDDPASIDRALGGVAAVINCAGPFLDTATPLIEAALRARLHYLDVTAEQPSARASFERFAAPAEAAGVVVLPAMGFYGGLADLLATAAVAEWGGADEISVRIALDSWRPTAGTRLTGKRNTARRLVVADGRLEPLAEAPPAARWSFPEPFGEQELVELPFSETIVIARHLAVGSLRTFLNLAPLRDLRDPDTSGPVPADDSGRSAQTFLVDVLARRAAKTRRAIARGRDIYAVTAPLIVEATRRILDGEIACRGARAPGEIFDAADFLRALAPGHLTLERDAAT